MSLLGSSFVKKAAFSMMSSEQAKTAESLLSAFESGEIDRNLAKKVGDKVSKFTPEDVNKMLELIDKNF